MDKDYNLKQDPRYQTAQLRERVQLKTKRIHDEGGELKQTQAKRLPNPKNEGRGKTNWNKNQ